MTLPTMKAGDRVRITVEGEVISQNGFTWTLRLDGHDGNYSHLHISTDELTAPTARVEVLPPPVDPDLLLAREFFKTKHPHADHLGVDRGQYDDWTSIAFFLAGLKASKAGGRV